MKNKLTNNISKKLLIVIPTYNEALNIKKLIDIIRKHIANCGLLIVDDNSSDGTADIVKEIQKNDKNTFLLQRESKLGIGTAYVAGLKWGLNHGYEYLAQMDADLSHDPRYLKLLTEKIYEYDFVIGSRNIEGGKVLNWPIARKILSKVGNFYARKVLSIPIYDLTGGFNIWRKTVLEDINLNEVESADYSFNIELKYKAYKKGYSFVEIPISFKNRINGISKLSFRIILDAFWKALNFRANIKK